jgi:hypothetical protein
MRVGLQCLLHDQRKSIETLAQVGMPRRKPHPNARRHRNHRVSVGRPLSIIRAEAGDWTPTSYQARQAHLGRRTTSTRNYGGDDVELLAHVLVRALRLRLLGGRRRARQGYQSKDTTARLQIFIDLRRESNS